VERSRSTVCMLSYHCYRTVQGMTIAEHKVRLLTHSSTRLRQHFSVLKMSASCSRFLMRSGRERAISKKTHSGQNEPRQHYNPYIKPRWCWQCRLSCSHMYPSHESEISVLSEVGKGLSWGYLPPGNYHQFSLGHL
jgi:hypothetical protein